MDEIDWDEQLVLTDHARKRGRQRNFSDEEVRYVLKHGRKLWRTGICFHFLAAKDVPLPDRHSQWAQRLVGTSVLVSHDSKCIITLYRNQKALHHIKKKSKRRVALRGEQAA